MTKPTADYDSVLEAIPETHPVTIFQVTRSMYNGYNDPHEVLKTLDQLVQDKLIVREGYGKQGYRRLTVEEIEAQGGNDEV